MRFLKILQREDGAMSLGRVLVFVFGVEIAAVAPYLLIMCKASPEFVAFLIFFSFLFCSLIYNKKVDSKFLNISAEREKEA